MMKNNPSISRFLSCLYRHTQMYFDRRLQPFGISYGSLAFLMVLFHHDGIHQEEISRKLSIDKATTARAIQKLVELGYINRVVDQSDRRAYQIFLTAKGEALKPELKRLSREWAACLTDGFTDTEIEQSFRLLEKMSQNALRFKNLL